MQGAEEHDLRLSRFSPADRSACQALLAGHAEALLYHTIFYKDFLEDLLGCESEYWLAWEGERLTGILPLMWRDGPLGPVANSLPFFGSHGGPIAVTDSARAALWNVFEELASRPGVAAATAIGSPFDVESPPIHWNLVDERIGQMSSLEGEGSPEDRILHMIDGSAVRNIRKAERSDVTVAIENDRLDFLADAHRASMAEINGTPKPATFFQKVTRYFRADGDYRIYIARRGGEPIAGLLVFYFNRVVEYFVPATIKSARELQPMALILYRAMLDATNRGCILWNWGGTWPSQEGVYRFKRKWGAKDFPYRYFTVVNNQEVLHSSAHELLAHYSNFFVVPFRYLASTRT
jgi:hypothetical protein